MNLPSLYFSVLSYARSYFHPTTSLHCRQQMSLTMCRPVVMCRSPASPCWILTTELNRKAFPCWPRKFCEAQKPSACASSTDGNQILEAGAATHPADNLIVIRKMSLAVAAAVDSLGVEVDIVRQAHLARRWTLRPRPDTRRQSGCRGEPTPVWLAYVFTESVLFDSTASSSPDDQIVRTCSLLPDVHLIVLSFVMPAYLAGRRRVFTASKYVRVSQ